MREKYILAKTLILLELLTLIEYLEIRYMVLKKDTFTSSPSSDKKNILSLVIQLSQNQLKIEAYNLSTRGQQ